MQKLRAVFQGLLSALLVIATVTACSPQAKKARFLERANNYFKTGEYDKARIEYMNVLGVDHVNATAFAQIGRIWLEDGAPLRAGAFLTKARELAPNDIDNRARLARALLLVGQFPAAKNEAVSILRQSPTNREAMMVLAESARTPEEVNGVEQELQNLKERDAASFQLASAILLMRKGDFAAAEPALQQAAVTDPKTPSAHLFMGALYLIKKDLERAGQEFKTAAELASIRSTEKMKYAEFKAQTGGVEEAKTFLKPITAQAPDYLPAWNLLAQIAWNEKKYDESLAFLENVFSRDPENIEANMLRAQIRLAKNEEKKAIEELERLDAKYPNVPGIKFQLARAYLKDKNAPQATAALNQAIAANPDFTEAILALAELDLRGGNASAAEGRLVELLKKRPGLAPAELLLAEAYRSQRRWDEAAAIFRKQISASPQNAQPYVLLGMILRQAKKTDEARKFFEKALELAPDNPMPTEQLVDLDISDKAFDAASQRVQTQLQKTPDSARVHFLEGKVYAAKANWDAAETALHKAIDLDSTFRNAYELLVSVYVATNKLPQAISELQTFLSKDPDNQGALITLASIYDKQNDAPKARDAYEKILSKNPDSVMALNNLAVLYAERLNQLDKASELARKAQTLQPADASIADTMGWILYKQGNYQQALTLLQESVAKLADNPDVQFHFGMASYMMGQTDVARTAFQKAVSAPGDFPGKQESQRRLALLDSAGTSKDLSVEDLEGVLKQQPNDLIALTRLGEAYEKQRTFDKAAAAYERAIKLNPKLLMPTTKLAQFYAGPLQNKDKALELAKKAREIAPTDPQTAGILGGIAFSAGNFTWAYSLLQESARQLPNDARILHDFAWAAYSLGKVSEAQQNMERVLKAAPETPQSKDAKSFLMMTALDESGKDPVPAASEIEQNLKADPNDVPALMARAAIEIKKGQTKAAAETYNKVLGRFPDFAPAQKHLAALYAEEPANTAKAYELAMKARQTLSDDSELAKTLASISFQRKEYPRAIQLLHESARKTPLDAKALYYLGMSYLQSKQEPQARETLNRSLTAGLQDPLATEARRALAELDKHKP